MFIYLYIIIAGTVYDYIYLYIYIKSPQKYNTNYAGGCKANIHDEMIDSSFNSMFFLNKTRQWHINKQARFKNRFVTAQSQQEDQNKILSC